MVMCECVSVCSLAVQIAYQWRNLYNIACADSSSGSEQPQLVLLSQVPDVVEQQPLLDNA